MTAQRPGTYTVTCEGAPDDTFGVGRPASLSRIGAPVILGIAGGALGLAGIVTGIVGLLKK